MGRFFSKRFIMFPSFITIIRVHFNEPLDYLKVRKPKHRKNCSGDLLIQRPEWGWKLFDFSGFMLYQRVSLVILKTKCSSPDFFAFWDCQVNHIFEKFFRFSWKLSSKFYLGCSWQISISGMCSSISFFFLIFFCD